MDEKIPAVLGCDTMPSGMGINVDQEDWSLLGCYAMWLF
jgi:hypothetical protein